MGFLGKSSTVLGSFVIFLVVAQAKVSRNSSNEDFHKSLQSFRQIMLDKIDKSHGNKNFVYSPFSIQSSMSMIRMGADGKTANEMDRILGPTTKFAVNRYHSLLSEFENSDGATMANKIYLTNGTELQDNFKNIFKKHFSSSAESINFGQSQEAANSMNSWIESKTNHIINDTVASRDIDALTEIVLLNVINFKGDWLKPFYGEPRDLPFHNHGTNAVDVPVIQAFDDFYYDTIPDLDATVVRLLFRNSDLSLLIILPDSSTGLAEMQKKLKHSKLQTYIKKLYRDEIFIIMPKFKVEFTIDLTDTLKELGLQHMFEDANFGKMFKTPENLSISKVIHKAIVEVDKKGTAPFRNDLRFIMTYSEYHHPKLFAALHPFYYAILNGDNVVLLEGNIVQFE